MKVYVVIVRMWDHDSDSQDIAGIYATRKSAKNRRRRIQRSKEFATWPVVFGKWCCPIGKACWIEEWEVK
jgi:hypothetical protein